MADGQQVLRDDDDSFDFGGPPEEPPSWGDDDLDDEDEDNAYDDLNGDDDQLDFDLPNGQLRINDDDDEDDLTGLSGKLQNIPDAVLNGVPRDVYQEGRPDDDTVIKLNGLGMPTDFDPEKLKSKASSSTASPFHSKIVEQYEKRLSRESSRSGSLSPSQQQPSPTEEVVGSPPDIAAVDTDEIQPVRELVEAYERRSASPPELDKESLRSSTSVESVTAQQPPVETNEDDFGDFDVALPQSEPQLEAEGEQKPDVPPEPEQEQQSESEPERESTPQPPKEPTNEQAPVPPKEATPEPEPIAKIDNSGAGNDDFGDFADFSAAPAPALVPESPPVVSSPTRVTPTMPSSAMPLETILSSLQPTLSSVIKALHSLSSSLDDSDDSVAESRGLDPDNGDPVWCEIRSVQDTPALEKHWTKYKTYAKWMTVLNMDPKNNVFIPRNGSPNIPAFASGLMASTGGLLEPSRVPEVERAASPKLDLGPRNQDAAGLQSTTNNNIPDPKFDWQNSGLTNPLDANNADSSASLLDLNSLLLGPFESPTGQPEPLAPVVVGPSADFEPKTPATVPQGPGGLGPDSAQRFSRPTSPAAPGYSQESQSGGNRHRASIPTAATHSSSSPAKSKTRTVLDSFPLLNFMQASKIQFPSVTNGAGKS